MSLTFLAAQNVSLRQNEVLGDCHRSRLKIPRKSLVIDAEEEVHPDIESPVAEEQISNNQQSDDEQSSNNNNDQIYDFNEKSCYPSLGVPVEAFPPSLIKWPLDNKSKRKRLADIRNQVKQLTCSIKMTIDNEIEEGHEGAARGNPAPFSSYVNMSSMKDPSGTTSKANLPSIEDIIVLVDGKKTKELKMSIRRSPWPINNPIRENLWKTLCQSLTREKFTDLYYWDTVQQLYGTKDLAESHVVLPSFLIRQRLHSYDLSDEGVKACRRVMSVIAYSFPAITFCPLVYPLTAIFMHYMNEPDAYNCVSILLSKGSHFISQTKILYNAMWRTVESLSKKHIRGSYMMLQKFGISEEQKSQGFQQWLWWMFASLPLSHLVRIIDCFLLEGNKILIRCSMAVFHLYIRKLSRDSNLAAALTTKGFPDAISSFCISCPFSGEKLLKSGFGIKALSKSEIQRILIQSEAITKDQSSASNLPESGTGIEGLLTSESQINLQKSSHTFDLKEGSSSEIFYSVRSVKSNSMNHDELLTIWSWLPTRMTMYQPTLIYTTEEHGSSITNFYNRVDKHEPTLLIVRTTDDSVFGAYCSTSWGERKHLGESGHRQTYFGTGETFLFTLRPKLVKYEWIGITRQRKDAELSSMNRSEELFMHADNEMISVGGGQGHGLMLDHELQTGKTERCETFDNPPLCSSGHFDIKVVEVYSLLTE